MLKYTVDKQFDLGLLKSTSTLPLNLVPRGAEHMCGSVTGRTRQEKTGQIAATVERRNEPLSLLGEMGVVGLSTKRTRLQLGECAS